MNYISTATCAAQIYVAHIYSSLLFIDVSYINESIIDVVWVCVVQNYLYSLSKMESY